DRFRLRLARSRRPLRHRDRSFAGRIGRRALQGRRPFRSARRARSGRSRSTRDSESLMDAIEITGGRPLRGEVAVSGSKNATLPQIAATLLASGESRLRGVPDLADVRTLGRLLHHMGAKVERATDGSLMIDASGVDRPEAPYELVKTMRASVLVLGPLLARFGKARVSLPGGCAIGARPIDQHLKGLQALGAKIELAHGYVE